MASYTSTCDSVWLKDDGHFTLGSTIDDWRTPVSVNNDTALGFTAARCVQIPNSCNMVLFKAWAESGVAPTWKIGAWRYNPRFSQWTCWQVGIVTVTAHASTGGTALPMDYAATLYPPLSHTVVANSSWLKYADGDATYKVPGCVMFDPCGSRLLTFQPYHSSATSKANGQVSWW